MLSTRMATLADLAAIQALTRARTMHQHQLDPRLPEGLVLPVWLAFVDGGATWVAESDGRVVGVLCVEPEYWYEESAFANVFPRSYLRLRLYILPGVAEEPVAAGLIARADSWPGADEVDGMMLLAPCSDGALGDGLAAVGFAPYHTIAIQPMAWRPAAAPPDGVTIRAATRRDIGPVAGLMAESWRFHAAHQPAIRLSPCLLDGCEQQARQLGADRDDQRLLLAEQDGEVIAFFAIGLNIQQANTRPGLFMPGIYGDIFEVAVRENRRRGGVGTALFEAAWAWFAAQGTQAVFVNYAPTNPISSRFWPRLGFVDAWTNWWRDRR